MGRCAGRVVGRLDGLVWRGFGRRRCSRLRLEGRDVALRDASEIWGKGIHETVAFFQRRYGRRTSRSAPSARPESGCRASRPGSTKTTGPSVAAEPAPSVEQAAQGHRHPGAAKKSQVDDPVAWKTARAPSGSRRHPRREAHHQPSQGGSLGLRHQLFDEHRQRHRRTPHTNSRRHLLRREAEGNSVEYVARNLLW